MFDEPDYVSEEEMASSDDGGVPIEESAEEIEADENDASEEKQGLFFRPVKTYVIRAGRMTDREKINYAELSQAWCIPFEHRTLNYTEVFGNNNPVTIEIGFGMGQATALIAEANPDMNYLGIEVHKPGVGRLLGEIQSKSLTNLYIMEHDALEFLETMIPDDSVESFHIFFPDPWPKKKHHKRRLLQRPRTNLLAQKLAPGGTICFATDWDEYAESALEELSATEGLKNKYQGYAPHQEWRPRTKFEQKGMDAGREIHELVFVKKEDEDGSL